MSVFNAKNVYISETVQDRVIFDKTFDPQVICGVYLRLFPKLVFLPYLAATLNVCVKSETHLSRKLCEIQQFQLIGTLCFCCAKTISLSLAKQYSSFKLCPCFCYKILLKKWIYHSSFPINFMRFIIMCSLYDIYFFSLFSSLSHGRNCFPHFSSHFNIFFCKQQIILGN